MPDNLGAEHRVSPATTRRRRSIGGFLLADHRLACALVIVFSFFLALGSRSAERFRREELLKLRYPPPRGLFRDAEYFAVIDGESSPGRGGRPPPCSPRETSSSFFRFPLSLLGRAWSSNDPLLLAVGWVMHARSSSPGRPPLQGQYLDSGSPMGANTKRRSLHIQ